MKNSIHLQGVPRFWVSKEKSYSCDGGSKYEEYTNQIRKTMYYGQLPFSHRPSLPLTGVLVDKFGKFCKQDGFNQLSLDEASSICYDACVTPCSVIVALLYLDRLRTQNPHYLSSTSPSQVLVVALMVASKYLYDDGEDDEVFNDEWATSAAILLSDLNEAEKQFLSAIDWNLFVDIKLFMDGLLYVESIIACEQGCQRGFYVYSDLVCLSKLLPPLWTSLLNLVGSALVVCVVSYTAILSTVIAGSSILSEDCAIQITHLGLLSSAPITKNLVLNSSIPPLALSSDFHTSSGLSTLENSLNEVGFPKTKNRSEEMSPEHVSTKDFAHSSFIDWRFSALRTLTTALLFASSSKIANVPQNRVSHFSPVDETCGWCELWSHPPPDDVNHRRNLRFGDHGSGRLSESHRLARRWRKPNKTDISSPTFSRTCDESRIATTCFEESSEIFPLLGFQEHEDKNVVLTHTSYYHAIMNSFKAFLYPKYVTDYSPNGCPLLRLQPFTNVSSMKTSNEHSSQFLEDFGDRSSCAVSDENFIPLWIWNSLPAITHSTMNFGAIDVDWKVGNLVLMK